MKASTVGLAIGKSVFQVHMEDAAGRIVAQRRLRRAQVATFFARLPASVVGIEACGSAQCLVMIRIGVSLFGVLILRRTA